MADIALYRLVCNFVGALAAAIVASTLFTIFGYSGGATIRDFGNELAISVISFGSAAVFVSYIVSRDKFLLEVGLVSLLGALMDFVLKEIVIQGPNGLPSYIERASEQHSLKPLLALMSDCLMFTAVLAVISVPFVALGAWICRLVKPKFSSQG